jgi:hypothetical protein
MLQPTPVVAEVVVADNQVLDHLAKADQVWWLFVMQIHLQQPHLPQT